MDSNAPAVAEGKDDRVSGKKHRLKGMKIRDEFICPITYELMKDPAIALDGHTYERIAIEKWLKSHNTSPRTGEPMQSILIPNLNMKKLIQDLIDEGGAGFYTNDLTNKDRLFEVRPEKLLTLECLGPPESDWNQQSFVVSSMGCIGGRKVTAAGAGAGGAMGDDGFQAREPMIFKDITVSRKHFEVTQRRLTNGKQEYFVRDLGSAGGTFIRIAHGARKQLHPGMIILLGKHQFTVGAIDDGVSAAVARGVGGSELDSGAGAGAGAGAGGMNDHISDAGAGAPGTGAGTGAGAGAKDAKYVAGSSGSGSLHRLSSVNANAVRSLVDNAERIIADLAAEEKETELSARVRDLAMELSSHLGNESLHDAGFVPDLGGTMDGSNQGIRVFDLSRGGGDGGVSESDSPMDCDDYTAVADAKSEGKRGSECDAALQTKASSTAATTTATTNHAHKRCILTCCAPDGSPLQGKSYVITTEGAGLGRKSSNTIPLLMPHVDNATGEHRMINVDTAISSEHARVDFDRASGNFFINDGGALGKASTNGTWYRLSGPHQESPPHKLEANMELLIGTVRFIVRETMTIAEHGVDIKSPTGNSGIDSSSNRSNNVTAATAAAAAGTGSGTSTPTSSGGLPDSRLGFKDDGWGAASK